MNANRELHDGRIKLERVNPEFLTNLTHEFITPLSIISVNLQIIEKLEAAEKDHDGKPTQKYLGNIKNQVSRLNVVVKDSIDLLRLDTMNEEVRVDKTDLVEVLDAVKSSIDLCQHHLLYRKENDLDLAMANTDQRLLRTSIFRLVNHACSTYQHKMPELVLREEQGQFVVEVINHDISLDADDFQHIFNPFTRTTELEKIEGMSLALTIIKIKLKLTGAKFEVECLEEGGVKYRIMVPAFPA